MQKLFIPGNDNTAKVNFDPERNIFEISGSSHPENPMKYFQPVINWVAEYGKKPNKKTVVNVKLEYFNSSSAKYLLNLFWEFEKINKINPVTINWYYQEEDLDAYASGERYGQLTTMTFNLIKY